jgi:hypothetical protein
VLTDIPDRPGAIEFVTAIATAIVQERLQGDKALLSTPLKLIFPDNAFLPARLALDPVLKCITCLWKLLDHLVAPLASAIFAEAGRKIQGLPEGKFVRCHVLLQPISCMLPVRQHAVINECYSVWRLTAEVFPCCPRSSS